MVRPQKDTYPEPKRSPHSLGKELSPIFLFPCPRSPQGLALFLDLCTLSWRLEQQRRPLVACFSLKMTGNKARFREEI